MTGSYLEIRRFFIAERTGSGKPYCSFVISGIPRKGLPDTKSEVRSDLTAKQKDKILGENAAKLLNL